MDFSEQAKALVAKMTLEEKASLCSGKDFWRLKAVERLGLPSIMVTDGPHGLRKQAKNADQLGINDSVPSTCFPTASLTACSFDRELLREIGKAIGEECREEDVAVLLGPGVNMKRSPLCGRNFEYFSEDPLLAGELAAAFIEGVQSQNVGTSLKHFAANNQEKLRMTSESAVDERALREIYLPAFEIAVKKAQPWTVMCSYNKLKGRHASDDSWLLTDVLRKDWGFQGLVVSDWGAVNDRIAGVQAGMDLEMPSTSRANDIAVQKAVESGALSAEDLDRNAARVVELILKSQTRKKTAYDKEAHHMLARKAAAASAVLLKNNEGILPLKPGQSLAVIGSLSKSPRYQGAGSSRINPHRIDSALDAFKEAGFAFTYAAGYNIDSDNVEEGLIEEACKMAKSKDVAVIFAGLPDRYESEGFDRGSLAMPKNHTALIERVTKANPNTVVVLQTGSVVECPWAEAVKGILLQYLGGQASCSATVELLTGKVNPSGKLAESWCEQLSDNPSYNYFPGYPQSVEYRESIYVGYRYYDTANKSVRWPFGYGLSYTDFAYADLTLDKKSLTDQEELKVSLKVTNTGERSGSETVEIFVAPKCGGVFRPAQELKAFDKVALEPGETKELTFTLDKRSFAYYNTLKKDWTVESGEYEIRVCASSRDIRLKDSVRVEAAEPAAGPDYREIAPCYYDLTKGLNVSEEAFKALLGRPLPQRERQKGDAYTNDSTVAEIQSHWFGRILASAIKKQAMKTLGSDPGMKLMMEAMLSEAPLRMLLMAGGDAMTPQRLNGIVDILNNRPISGLKKMGQKN